MTQVGRKDDDGKIWAATVLAGFRDVLEADTAHDRGDDRESDSSEIPLPEVDRMRSALSQYLDTDLSIEERFRCAAAVLRTCPTAIRGACEVGSYGARKYDRDNWLHVPDGISRYYEAGGRHILDMLCGETIDSVERGGSGLPNLYHVCWNIFAGATLAARARRRAPLIDSIEAFIGAAPPATSLPKLKLPIEVDRSYKTHSGDTVLTDHNDDTDSTIRFQSKNESLGCRWVYTATGKNISGDAIADLVEGPL